MASGKMKQPSDARKVRRTLHPGPCTSEEAQIREEFGDQVFTENDAMLGNLYRGVLYRRGAPYTTEDVQDLRTIVWERVCRGGRRAPSLIARYDPAKYGAASVLEPVDALMHWIATTARREAALAADNKRRRTRERRNREVSRNGRV